MKELTYAKKIFLQIVAAISKYSICHAELVKASVYKRRLFDRLWLAVD